MQDDTINVKPVVPKERPGGTSRIRYGDLDIFDKMFLGTMFVITLAVCLIAVAIAIGLTQTVFPSTFERQNAYIQECIQSDQYTRDECIQMSIVEFRGDE